MLRSLLSREKSTFNPGAQPVQDLEYSTTITISGDQPGRGAELRSGMTNRSRRPPLVKVGRLYPERKSEPEVHARGLLKYVQTECEQLVGSYVPKADLESAYCELCELEGWSRKHWCAVGRELAKLTEKRLLQRQGQRFRAYRIPRPERSSRKLV